MSNTVFKRTEIEKDKMRIRIESPEDAWQDKEIISEVREILFSALREQTRDYFVF